MAHSWQLSLPLTRPRIGMLVAFSLTTPLLIPVEIYWLGAIAWVACAVLVARDPEPAVRRRMGTLLAVIALLAASPIHTETTNEHFLTLGIPFALVVIGPAVYLGMWDPGVIRYRLWPRNLRWLDIIYTLISIPLAWGIIKVYWWASPHMPMQWTLPPDPDPEQNIRLFVGINCVGLWDELFFVNTVFAVLRSLFRFRVANAVQAVVYTSVLNDMAFTGIGPPIVYFFAWTQGAMFEKSENLLYVLLVHLIVDAFLVAAIVGAYYPGYSLGWH